MASEVPLTGGRVTEGVTRAGDTVRRPLKPNSLFVRALLVHLHDHGFGGAPRYLGVDDRGREVFSFLSGEVPPELDPAIPDELLALAARLIRRYHDAAASSPLIEGCETVCHNDLSPCNFVFRDGLPVGIIDFDSAAPGARLRDVGYALFLWLNLGTDGPLPTEQARRIKLFCGAYGVEADGRVIDAIAEAVAANVERLHAENRLADAEWWQSQREWLDQRRDLLQLVDG
jgi:Ser/Thr protein kinase RdoA (MazF antagonist)